jgi:hypothetical protein
MTLTNDLTTPLLITWPNRRPDRSVHVPVLEKKTPRETMTIECRHLFMAIETGLARKLNDHKLVVSGFYNSFFRIRISYCFYSSSSICSLNFLY